MRFRSTRELILALANVDLVYLRLSALLCAADRVLPYLRAASDAGELTEAERTLVRTHPDRGHAMLVGRGFAEEVLAVVRGHHEMLDGSGYPDGLRGAAIPDLVRLVTVCDVYGALIEHRAYRRPMPADEAYSILESMVGKLDGDFVRAFRPVAAAFGPAVSKVA